MGARFLVMDSNGACGKLKGNVISNLCKSGVNVFRIDLSLEFSSLVLLQNY